AASRLRFATFFACFLGLAFAAVFFFAFAFAMRENLHAMRAVLVILALASATARAEPSDKTLVYTGLALAPPTYLIGVALHEGSHAIAAELVGADVVDVHLFPPGRDPKV